MPRRTDIDRARRWARALNTIDQAPERLFVDGQKVWCVDDPADTGDWLVGSLDHAPPRGRPVGPVDRTRLRDAVTVLERARDLSSLSMSEGLAPLRRFRGVDLDRLRQTGHRRLQRLDWATSGSGERSTPPPLGVLAQALPSDPSSLLRNARVPLPLLPRHLTTDLFDRDLEIAARLVQWDLAGVAEGWLRTAAALWWPPPVHITVVDGFFAELVHRPGGAKRIARAARSYATREGFYGVVPSGLSDLNATGDALRALIDHGSDEDPEVWRPSCMQLHLAAPTLRVLSNPYRLSTIRETARTLRGSTSRSWREQVGPHVPAVLNENGFPRWVADLPATLAARVLAQWRVPDYDWDHRLLDRYVRACSRTGRRRTPRRGGDVVDPECGRRLRQTP